MKDSVVVHTFTSRMEAEIAKGLLEAHKINAAVVADDAGGMYPSLASAAEGVQLVVGKKDYKRAAELLNEKKT